MRKKVLLIYPPSTLINREDRCQVPFKEVQITAVLPPMDLLYIAAVLERAGHECLIEDYPTDGKTMADFRCSLESFQPDFLIISITTPSLKLDMEVCDHAKQVNPKIITLAKGAHFLQYDKHTLENYPNLDIVIRGEAELTAEEICGSAQLEEVEGITYRRNGEIVRNFDRPFIKNLDDLPFPARHLIDNQKYRRPDNNKPQAVLKVSRGCPHSCIYCLGPAVSGKTVRRRSPANILDEAEECVNKYHIKDIIFWSELFTTHKPWVMALCDELLRRHIKINWSSNTRVDTIDLEMATAMKKSGCFLLSMGIESGDQDILDRMKKKATVEDAKRAIDICRQVGIKSFTYYLIGLPWDTEESVQNTINLALELDSDYATFFTATAFPATELYDIATKHGLFEDQDPLNSYNHAYYEPTTRGFHLSKQDIMRLQEEATRRFYFRPSFMLRTLFRIRSLSELSSYTSAGLSMMTKYMIKTSSSKKQGTGK